MKITDFDKVVETANYAVNTVMVNLIFALAFSKKPIIAVVRGGCVGIAFTILSHVSLVYCGSDAYFKAPLWNHFKVQKEHPLLFSHSNSDKRNLMSFYCAIKF